jgi:hypothetical protein
MSSIGSYSNVIEKWMATRGAFLQSYYYSSSHTNNSSSDQITFVSASNDTVAAADVNSFPFYFIVFKNINCVYFIHSFSYNNIFSLTHSHTHV